MNRDQEVAAIKKNATQLYSDRLAVYSNIPQFLKKSISHKPDSVIPVNRDGYHLSGCTITGTILLPTLPGISKDNGKRAAYLIQQMKEFNC